MASTENPSNPDANELLRLLSAQATEHAVILLDPQGTITAWLPAAEVIFGYSASEIIGERHSILFSSEDVQKGAPEKELAIASSGAPAEDDRWMRRKDGSRFWAVGVLEAIRSSDGALLGYGKVLRNRTDLKGQLEGLEKEIERLEKSGQRKNTFISTLAHELRNPLSSFAGAVELLQAILPDSEDATFAMAIMRRQIDSMRRLVDDLLDVTRISAGKLQLALREESLGEIVKDAVENCRPLINDRTHDFHLFLGDEPLIVQADAVRLRQVFVNLIENAAKYTEYGGTIWVKMLVEGQEAVVKVEDSGIGISADVLPRIFDLFTQAEFVGDHGKAGLGIGLSVVKDITRLHGGTVQVRSDGIGRGSEFVVRLPLAGADENRPDSPMADWPGTG